MAGIGQNYHMIT